MEIVKNRDGTTLLLAITGRLDTLTAPQFEENVKGDLDGISKAELDFAGVEYISSAGLRSLLSLQKKIGGKEAVVVKNANEVVKEIFAVTGFSKVLTIA